MSLEPGQQQHRIIIVTSEMKRAFPGGFFYFGVGDGGEVHCHMTKKNELLFKAIQKTIKKMAKKKEEK